MKNYPKIFVVVLNYNGGNFIKKCLTSVFKNDYPNFEVVVVDNNSNDGSLEMAKSNFSKADFIKNEENFGYAAGNNVGIRYSLERMADYVCVLNNDAEVEEDFLGRLVGAMEKDNEIGIASPVIFNGNNKQVWFSKGKIDWLKMKVVHSVKIETKDVYESDFISGCAMMISSEVFNEVGLLDEDFFLYWEDADFSYRVKKAGFKNVIVTASWAYHFEKSQDNLENKTYWLVISGLIFFKKNAPLLLKPWIKVYVCLRKLKNHWDVLRGKNKLAKVVKKAYKDFKNAKF